MWLARGPMSTASVRSFFARSSFKSAAHLQRFASVHGLVQNLFRVGRHLLRSAHHRLLRAQAFRVLGGGGGRLLTNERRTLPRDGHAYWSVNLTVPQRNPDAGALPTDGSDIVRAARVSMSAEAGDISSK